MDDPWLAWARRLQALASTGLYFCNGPYDAERYRELADIANAMLATLGSVPIARIEQLVPDFAKGYATPQVDVRGAVFRDDRILLVREAADGLWTLPGGYAEVGISPGDNVVKEVWEEASIRVTARALYAVRHKARHDYDPDLRDFYKLFFLCEPLAGESFDVRPGTETLDARFFGIDELPPLSTDRVIAEDIHVAFANRHLPAGPAVFD